MAFRHSAPNFGAAARDADQLANVLRDYHQRFEKLEKRLAAQAVSTREQTPVAGKPPHVLFRAEGAPGKGRYRLVIRNPEFGNTAGTGKTSPKPIYHHVEYSADPNFRSGVTVLEPSHQTHFTILEDPNQSLYFRLRSSYDGVHFNLPQYSGAVKG